MSSLSFMQSPSHLIILRPMFVAGDRWLRPSSAFTPHTPIRTKLSAKHPQVEAVYSNLLHNYEKVHEKRRSSLRSNSVAVTAIDPSSPSPKPIKPLTLKLPNQTPLTHPAFLSNRNTAPQRSRLSNHKRRQSLPFQVAQAHPPSSPLLASPCKITSMDIAPRPSTSLKNNPGNPESTGKGMQYNLQRMKQRRRVVNRSAAGVIKVDTTLKTDEALLPWKYQSINF